MRSSLSRFPVQGSDLTLTGVMIIGFVVLGVASGAGIFSHAGILAFLGYLSVPILIGLSQMAVLGVGQLNLAIGAMGGAVCAMMAVLMSAGHVPVAVALILGLVAATLLGAINGLLVVVTGLHGFVVTLGTMTILLGVQFTLVGTQTLSSYSTALRNFGRQNIVGIPFLFICTLIIAALTYVFFIRTVPGRQVLASGGSAVSARLSGISNARTMVIAFAVSGLLTGFAALASIASLSGISTTMGSDWLLPSFAAPLIAGVLLTGGSVAVYGTVIAAAILRIVDVVRAQFLLDPSWTNFVIGAVVLGTVAITEYRKRRSSLVRLARNRLGAVL